MPRLFWLSLWHDAKNGERKMAAWHLQILFSFISLAFFFLFMSRSRKDSPKEAWTPLNQPHLNVVLLTENVQSENKRDFFCDVILWFHRVLIRVIIVQEMLIKQVPLVVDTWGKTHICLGMLFITVNQRCSRWKSCFTAFFSIYIQLLSHTFIVNLSLAEVSR